MTDPDAEAAVEGGRCRLLVELAAPPDAALRALLDQLATADRLAAIVVDPDGPAAGTAVPTAKLLAGAFEPEPGAHGVVASLGEDADMETTALRRAWGAEGIVVAGVGTSRHRAMEAGEAGADAILFEGPDDAVVDCLDWWQALFVLPAAARATTASLERVVRAGADLLLVEAAVLTADVADRLTAAEAARAADHASGAAASGANREER